jgi:hypothetical protein
MGFAREWQRRAAAGFWLRAAPRAASGYPPDFEPTVDATLWTASRDHKTPSRFPSGCQYRPKIRRDEPCRAGGAAPRGVLRCGENTGRIYREPQGRQCRPSKPCKAADARRRRDRSAYAWSSWDGLCADRSGQHPQSAIFPTDCRSRSGLAANGAPHRPRIDSARSARMTALAPADSALVQLPYESARQAHQTRHQLRPQESAVVAGKPALVFAQADIDYRGRGDGPAAERAAAGEHEIIVLRHRS